MTDDFSDLLTALSDAGVRFLVVGAHALAAHGVPRMTGDLDLWVEPTAQNADGIWAALSRFGAPLETLQVQRSDFVRPDHVIQIGLPPFRVELMTSISGVEFTDAWPRRVTGTLFGAPVAFIGRDDFIRNKRASGRPKDLEDIRSLGR